MDCKEGTARIIQQIQILLQSLNAEQYSQSQALLHGSSLGQHFRHIHDFYDCLLQQVPGAEIDYALRHRDPDIEQDPIQASSRFSAILAEVQKLDLGQPLFVHSDFDPQEALAERSLVASSVGRELMYAHDHALHHLAIVKIGLQQAFPTLTVPEELGVAPSTLKFRVATQQNND